MILCHTKKGSRKLHNKIVWGGGGSLNRKQKTDILLRAFIDSFSKKPRKGIRKHG